MMNALMRWCEDRDTDTRVHIYTQRHIRRHRCTHPRTCTCPCAHTQTRVHTNALRDADATLCQLSREDLPAPQSQNPEPRWGAHDADQTNLRSSLGFFQTGPQRGLSVRSGCKKVNWKLSSACCPAIQLAGAQLSPGRSTGHVQRGGDGREAGRERERLWAPGSFTLRLEGLV